MLNICTKFLENVLNDFEVIERTQCSYVEFQSSIIPHNWRWSYIFLFCAHSLMMFYICIKFQDYIFDAFEEVDRTRFTN